jgi:mono/diheme cytochrome c family protein
MGMAKVMVCVLATAIVLALAGGCGGESKPDAPTRTVVQINSIARDRWTYARARFHEMCAGCHTLSDARATGPRFNLDRAGGVTESRARFAIAKGEPGMPAWEHVLSKREFEELVAYLASVSRNDRGENDWLWQMRLRMAGERWKPSDSR